MGDSDRSRRKKCTGKECNQVLAHDVCMARAAVVATIDDTEADFRPRVLSQVRCGLQFFKQPGLVRYADHPVSVTMNDPYMRIDLAKHGVGFEIVLGEHDLKIFLPSSASHLAYPRLDQKGK
jgi:hypothetical protein